MVQRGQPKIDFAKVKTVIDLKDPQNGLSFDLLLDAMNQIKFNDD